MKRFILVIIMTILFVASNFYLCLAEKETSLDMNVYKAYEIVLGRVTNIKEHTDRGGSKCTIKVEKVLKRGRIYFGQTWADCYSCPQENQRGLFFIIKSGQAWYFLEHIQPVEKESQILSLLSEQKRIMAEGSSEEEPVREFIDSFCAVLENNDLDGFKRMLEQGVSKLDDRVIDDQIATEIFEELKKIHSQYNYKEIFNQGYKQQRYPIYKGIFSLGGHQYGHAYIRLERQNGNWFIRRIDHCY